MKSIFSFFFLFPILIFANSSNGEVDLEVNASAAILMNAETGAILFEKNAWEQNYPASLTKIATVLFALKQKREELDTYITATQEVIGSISPQAKKKSGYKLPSYWIEVGSTHMGMKKGEKLKFEDILYGTMLISAADGSNAAAQFVSGSVPRFIKQMNRYLKEIGCQNTNFCNPHGAHHPNHYTTAYDMALISREALKDPIIRKIVSTKRYQRPKTNKQEPTWMVNSNKLIKSGRYNYPYAIGLKTGYTEDAKNCLVAVAKKDGRCLIAVLLGCKNQEMKYRDAIKLFEIAFSQPKLKEKLLVKGEQRFKKKIQKGTKTLKTYIKEDISIVYYSSEKPSLKGAVLWHVPKLPIERGMAVGEVQFLDEEEKVVRKATLYAENRVPLPFLQRASESKWWLYSSTGIALILFSIYFKKRRKPKK